jgi:hypothetical protein
VVAQKQLVRGLLVGVTAGVAAVAPMVAAPAYAASQSGSGYFYQGAGNSYQYVAWNKAEHKVRLRVFADSGMNTSRCIDAMVDWHVSDDQHYDARVVRVCQPGAAEETDPGGDGYWQEPSDWDGRSVDGLRVAAAYVMDDTYPFDMMA